MTHNHGSGWRLVLLELRRRPSRFLRHLVASALALFLGAPASSEASPQLNAEQRAIADRIDALRDQIRKAEEVRPDGIAPTRLGQWVNWPNWPNWGDWPNWRNRWANY